MKTLKEAQTEAMHQATKDYMGQVLAGANGNVTAAAKAAGVERESFHRLMRKHGVDASVYRPKSDG